MDEVVVTILVFLLGWVFADFVWHQVNPLTPFVLLLGLLLLVAYLIQKAIGKRKRNE